MKTLKIVYMGTPDFAVSPLLKLLESEHQVVAVVTAPDKKSGRGLKITQSPVKEIATENNIPTLQPVNLKSEEFLKNLKSYNADLQVVVAFRMLPQVIWQLPQLGTINLHASLLPQYRGAAPIHLAIINGEKNTGLTTFFLKHEIDTGNIILQTQVPIEASDTLGSLYVKMSQQGAHLLQNTVDKIADNDYVEIKQAEGEPIKKAPKINKADCQINWNTETNEIFNFVRGLNPWPCAWTNILGFHMKVYAVIAEPNDSEITTSLQSLKPGEYWTDQQSILLVKANNGFIKLLELQKEGKKRMNVQEFLKGVKL